MSHDNDPPVIGNNDDTVEVTVPKGFIVADGNMEPEIVSLAAPEADPQQFAMDATGPIQTWTNEHVILPNIGDVDAKLLGLGGLSNTIVVSTTTAELLATITVNIGANGNWFVGDVDTGVPASGTDPESILRMVGAYIQAPMTYDVPSALMTISAGGHYVAYNGAVEGYVQFMVSGLITATIAASTKVVSMDSAGIVYQHTDPDLLLIPESQVILATFDGSDPARVMTVFPTVHQMVYGLQGVVSEIDGKVAEAEAWAIAAAASATEASGYATAAQNSANAAAASETQTGLDAAATAADRTQTGLDATATAADRVATNADAAQTAADRVQTGQDAASALDSKNLASEYAMNPEDAPITGHPADRSAYHWSEKARKSAESVLSGVHYKGQWDASLGAFPTPPVGPAEVVDYYRISAAGTMTGTAPQQPVTTAVGDTLYWDSVEDVWYEMESGDSVRTINSVLPDAFGNINVTTTSIGAVDLTTAQTINGIKTFGSAPRSSTDATDGTDLMRKSQVDANFVSKTSATGAAQLPSGTTAQRPTGVNGLVRFNHEILEYEGWNGTEWAPLGGGAGVPDPVIHTADATLQLEAGNWADLTSIGSFTGTIPAGMEIGDWFAVGDAYGLCSVYKPIVIPNCIWNGTALEDLVLTQKNINITLQKIDNLGGLKIVDGIGENGDSSGLPDMPVTIVAKGDYTTVNQEWTLPTHNGIQLTWDDFESITLFGGYTADAPDLVREGMVVDGELLTVGTVLKVEMSLAPIGIFVNMQLVDSTTIKMQARGNGSLFLIKGRIKYRPVTIGANGTFTSPDGKTITVAGGIITSIA